MPAGAWPPDAARRLARHILILQGHPTPGGGHLGNALAEAYARGAAAGGHEVRQIDLADLEFPILRSKEEWEEGPVPPAIQSVQTAIAWADHLVLFYPLWLGSLPALFKALLEQALRPGFAVDSRNGVFAKRLKGKSARIVVTMGMPALVYRWYFGAHSLKNLERNILAFCGIAPIRESIVGSVETMGRAKGRRWIDRLERLGRAGA
jgi:putative NADPH-quinone reductase